MQWKFVHFADLVSLALSEKRRKCFKLPILIYKSISSTDGR